MKGKDDKKKIKKKKTKNTETKYIGLLQLEIFSSKGFGRCSNARNSKNKAGINKALLHITFRNKQLVVLSPFFKCGIRAISS